MFNKTFFRFRVWSNYRVNITITDAILILDGNEVERIKHNITLLPYITTTPNVSIVN